MRIDLSRKRITKNLSSESLGLVSKFTFQKDLIEKKSCRVQPKYLNDLNYKKCKTFQSFYKALVKLRDKKEEPFYQESKLNKNENNFITSEDGSSKLSLRERLVNFDKEVISIACPNTHKGHRLLNPEILKILLEHEPTNMVEFGKKIPSYLRKPMQTLDPQHPDCQSKFIKDVVNIINEFSEK